MSNSNNVKTVTLIIEMGNGELHQIMAEKPGPQGGNPRFMQQQTDAAIAELAERAKALIATYGEQIPAETPGQRLGRQAAASLNRALGLA